MSTAYMNDCEPLLCFAQQVNGYGKAGDVFLALCSLIGLVNQKTCRLLEYIGTIAYEVYLIHDLEADNP